MLMLSVNPIGSHSCNNLDLHSGGFSGGKNSRKSSINIELHGERGFSDSDCRARGLFRVC